MTKERFSEFLLLLLAMIWGAAFVAGKFALEGVSPLWILVIRFFLSSILLVIPVYRELGRVNSATLQGGILVGALMAASIAFQIVGLQYTTPANQTFICVSYVVTVPLILWAITKERPKAHTLAGAVFVFTGVGLLSLQGLHMGFGDFLTLIYAILFAIQVIVISHYMGRVPSPMLFTSIQMFVAGVVSLVLALISGDPILTGPVTSRVWGGMFYLVVLNTSVAYFIQNYAQQYARPDTSVIILSSEVIFGALFAYFLAGEVFTPRKILGCLLVIFGIFLAQILPKLRKSRDLRGISG
ncbi:MAG: DMT family transporter [Tissierellia bacterium]|nr:DMT family transporter [Tissierellia bacterium]